MATNPATPEQITLVRGLFAEREIPNAVEFLGAVEDSIENGTLTSVWARDVLIPSLKRRPYTAAAIAEWQSTRPRTTGGRSRPELTGDRVIPSGAARAVGRFNPDGPTGFTSSLGGPVRATRPEAVEDYIATVTA
jgi:hypothetical protein